MLRRHSNKDGISKSEQKNSTKHKNSSSSILATLTNTSTPRGASLALERFNDHYDDSSDEETVTETNYDINESWHDARPHPISKKKTALGDDHSLSFVVHAAGLKILYSEPVNQLYYPLKAKMLTQVSGDDSAVKQLQKKVRNAILTSSQLAMVLLKRFLLLTGQKKLANKTIEAHIKKAQATFMRFIDEMMVDKTDIFIQWLSLNKLKDEDNKTVDMILFEKEVASALSISLLNAFSIKAADIDRDEIKSIVFNLANAQLDNMMSDLAFSDKWNKEGKEEAIAALDNYKGPYFHLAGTIKLMLNECSARGCVKNMILHKLLQEPYKSDLVQAYIEDLIVIHHSKKLSLSKQEKAAFKQYFSYDAESISDELTSHFSRLLPAEIKKEVHMFYRPILAKNTCLASDNPYHFLANLRLLNRSQKRNRLNLQHAAFNDDTATRVWRLAQPALPEADVIETQKILNASFGRKDIVEGIGNYEKVYDAIKQLKAYFRAKDSDVSDKDLALWMRSIFKGKFPALALPKIDNITILHKLQAITYLLFGCETTRNPGMAILNHMLLDLIIDHPKWTFKEAFTGKKRRMPMAPEGAVAVARAVEDTYRAHMPYPYFYPGVVDKSDNKFCMSDLIAFEATIVRAWVSITTDDVPESGESVAPWLLNLIEEHKEHWLDKAVEAPTWQASNAKI